MGEGFPKPIYWTLVIFLAMATGAALAWFAFSLNDFILRGDNEVMGRFDRIASVRITLALSICVVVPSRLLVHHCRRIQSYASPAEFVFSALFYVFLFLAMLCLLPALFSG